MTDTIMLTKNTDQLRQQVAAHVAARRRQRDTLLALISQAPVLGVSND